MINHFGEYFKSLRIKKGLTLRGFCMKFNYDPGNISRLERGLASPPKDVTALKEYAKNLGIKEGTTEWHTFVDLASSDAGVIPGDIRSDEEMLKKMPILFRTVRNKKITEEDLSKLIEKIRKA